MVGFLWRCYLLRIMPAMVLTANVAATQGHAAHSESVMSSTAKPMPAAAFTTRFAVFHLRHWRMASPSSSGIIIAFNVSFMSVNVALISGGEAGTRTPQRSRLPKRRGCNLRHSVLRARHLHVSPAGCPLLFSRTARGGVLSCIHLSGEERRGVEPPSVGDALQIAPVCFPHAPLPFPVLRLFWLGRRLYAYTTRCLATSGITTSTPPRSIATFRILRASTLSLRYARAWHTYSCVHPRIFAIAVFSPCWTTIFFFIFLFFCIFEPFNF